MGADAIKGLIRRVFTAARAKQKPSRLSRDHQIGEDIGLGLAIGIEADARCRVRRGFSHW